MNTVASLVLGLPLAFAPTPQDNDQDADAAALVGVEGTTRILEYPDESLTGDVLSPTGQLLLWRRPPNHPSLILIRPHFLPELVTLARDV